MHQLLIYNRFLDNKLNYYLSLLKSESDWLGIQQLSNGAFAFNNHKNGDVSVNPYFSEIVAFALINYENSEKSKNNLEKCFTWHFCHLNNKNYDINNLKGNNI